MDDLEIAKQKLKAEKLSLVIVKESKVVFETNREGLGGFLRAVDHFNVGLSGSSVADRIIGKAAAFLCAYADVATAFAVTLSRSGLETLVKFDVHREFEILVPTILNFEKTDKCPFEKLVEKISNPEEAYEKIKSLYSSRR